MVVTLYNPTFLSYLHIPDFLLKSTLNTFQHSSHTVYSFSSILDPIFITSLLTVIHDYFLLLLFHVRLITSFSF